MIAEDLLKVARRAVRAKEADAHRRRVQEEAERISAEERVAERAAERNRREAAADEAEKAIGLAEVRIAAYGRVFVFSLGHADHAFRQIAEAGAARLIHAVSYGHAMKVRGVRQDILNGTVRHPEDAVNVEALLNDDKGLRPCAVRGLVRVEDV